MDDTVAIRQGYTALCRRLFGRRIQYAARSMPRGRRRGLPSGPRSTRPSKGTAADVIRRAMVRMPEAIAGICTAKMLLQVHDELIFEVPKDAVEETTNVVRRVMEGACEPVVKLDVPLIVDAGVGDNWAEAH